MGVAYRTTTAMGLAALALLGLTSRTVRGQQQGSAWPGLWGPTRTASVPALSSPVSVGKELWRHRSEGGYSEVAVSGTRAVTMDLRDGVDFVVAFDEATGQPHWGARISPTYQGHDSSQDGPIATPAIDGDQVFAVGPHAVIVALDAATGREQWRHDLRAMGAAMPDWGFAASPLVEGRLVIVPTGGPESPGLLAFDRRTGRRVWSAGRGGAIGYSSASAAFSMDSSARS